MEADLEGLTFWEHVSVLRRYILWGGTFFIVATVVIFAYASNIITKYLLAPLHGEQLVFLSPTGPFFFEVHISFIGAMVVSFPVWLFLLSRFSADAFPAHKRKNFAWLITASTVFGFGSIALSYRYLVPISFSAFTHFIVPGTTLMLTADNYVHFVFLVTTVCFIVVELPVAIVALAYLHLVNPYFLSKHRRYLYLFVLVALGFITPTTDVLTLLAVTVPALLCTEIGLVIGKFLFDNEGDGRANQIES